MSILDAHLSVYGSFYSQAEFRLCRGIYDMMRKKNHDIYIGLESYKQDYIFAERLSAFLKSVKSYPVIFDAATLAPFDIIPHLLSSIIGNVPDDNVEKYFSQMLLSMFENGQKIVVILLNADQVNYKVKAVFQHLSQVIYEKFPEKKNQSLFRFIYCGDKENYIDFKYSGIYPTDYIADVPLSINDCHNACLFYNAPLDKDVLFYSTVQSFTMLRLLLPIATLPNVKNDFYEHINFYAKIIYDSIPNPRNRQKFHVDFHEFTQTASPLEGKQKKKDWLGFMKNFNLVRSS